MTEPFVDTDLPFSGKPLIISAEAPWRAESGENMSVTIRDVAKKAGVSTATVSKVMNGKPSISEETANRVREIMEELHYQPNLRAQNFAKRQTHTIVFATELVRNSAFEKPHMFEIMVGLEKVLSERKYVLHLVHVTRENCMDVLGNMIARKSVDGLVLHISIVTRELEKVILREDFPHIVLGCPEYKTQLCWIDNNNVLSGEMACAYLHRQGYRRMAFIGGQKADVGSAHRLQGYKNVLEQRHMRYRPEYVMSGFSTVESGARMMEALLGLADRPDSVICANNYLAVGAMNALHNHGVAVPGEMGLITFDTYPFSRITEPKMTTVDIDVYDMGKQAGEIILKKIKKPNLQMQSYTTLASLVVNGSTK